MTEKETGILFDREIGEIVQDPDLLRSKLPQPYRMIDKVLNEILDKVWDNISLIENKKEKFRNRYKPPRCQFYAVFRPFSNVTKFAISEESAGLVVVGLTDGLAIVNFSDRCERNLALWKKEGASLDLMSVMKCREGSNFYVATSDDKGIIRIFCFFADKLFLICQLREEDGTGPAQVKILDLRLSPCCKYIALSLQYPGENENPETFTFELYGLPADEWLQTMRSSIREHESKHDSGEFLLDPTGNVIQDLKFSSPKLLIKLEQPHSPTRLGRRILVTQSAIDSRWNLLLQAEKRKVDFVENFEKANFFPRTFRDGAECGDSGDKRKNVETAEWMRRPEKIPPTKPCFHFIATNKSTSQESITGQIMVFWKYRPDIRLYNLQDLKISDPTNPNPDIFWPTPGALVASGSSSDARMLAVVSDDNLVTTWDARLGIPKEVVRVEDAGTVVEVLVLGCTQETARQVDARFPEARARSAAVAAEYSIVVLSTTGFIYAFDADRGQHSGGSIDRTIDLLTDDSGEIPRGMHKLAGIKDAFAIVQADWRLFVYDMEAGRNVCEIVVPDCCCPAEPGRSSVASLLDGSDVQYLLATGCQGDQECNTKPEERKESPGGSEKGRESEEGENDSKMTSGDALSPRHCCLFAFKVSDFMVERRFDRRQNSLPLHPPPPHHHHHHHVSSDRSGCGSCGDFAPPSTLKESLAANKNILQRIRRQDCLRDRLAVKWLERRLAFSSAVV